MLGPNREFVQLDIMIIKISETLMSDNVPALQILPGILRL